MSRPVDLLDVLLGLAQRAAIAADGERAVLLAEINARLANAGDDPELDALRIEIARLAEVQP